MGRFSLTVVQGADNMPEGCELTEDAEGDYMLVSDCVAHTAALVQALKACARLRMDDGTFCWCDAPERHVHLNHDLWCRQARVALDGQP